MRFESQHEFILALAEAFGDTRVLQFCVQDGAELAQEVVVVVQGVW